MSEDTLFEPVESKEESFGAETPVTGQTKMQAAWSGSDDEKSSAQVAQSQQGQIFEQIYQPWTGTLNPRWMRNWAILRHHILGISKQVTDRGIYLLNYSYSS